MNKVKWVKLMFFYINRMRLIKRKSVVGAPEYVGGYQNAYNWWSENYYCRKKSILVSGKEKGPYACIVSTYKINCIHLHVLIRERHGA